MNKRLFLFNIEILSFACVILSIIIFVLLFGLSYLMNEGQIFFEINWSFSLLLIFLIVLHELLHGLGFFVFGKAPFKKIKYGFNIKKMIAYCTCEYAINKKAYFMVSVLPLIITSIFPVYFVLNTGRFDAILFITIAFSSCIGDIFMAIETLRLPKNSKVLDCPNAVGFYLIEDELMIEKKLFKPLFSKEEKKILKKEKSKLNLIYIIIVTFLIFCLLLLSYIFLRRIVGDLGYSAGKEKFKYEYKIE